MEVKKKEAPKKWHKQQEVILKQWGESSSCYRFMHFQAYEKYKSMSMKFTLPIIVISTVTGTANFAQETFPDSWKTFVPIGIGGFNLIAAIMTTVLQFLKANELMEAHRVSSISYGKLSRFIKLEMNLPIYERSQSGAEMIDRCKTEYDRLIEQSPPIPGDVLRLFEKKFPITKFKGTRPEIADVDMIDPFDTTKEQTAVSSVANIFKKKLSTASDAGKRIMGIPIIKSSATKQAAIMDELKMLKSRNLVTSQPDGPDKVDPDTDVDEESALEEGEIQVVTEP